MGIKNLLKLMNNKEDLVIERTNEDYIGKRIAIDISILIYQVVISIRNTGTDLKNKNGEITSHILGLFNKTIVLLEKGVIPIFVFDGKPPELKNKVLLNRKNIRKKAALKLENAVTDKEKIKYFKRSVSISKKQMDQCRELLDLMGIPYVQAPEEADSQCAYLNKNGFVDAVSTEDMDILTFGAPKIVRNLSSFHKKPIEIKLDNILNSFDLNQDQFVELCILLGCDYSGHISSIDCYDIYKYYNKNKDFLKTLKDIKNNNYYTSSFKNYLKVKDYFKNPLIKEVNKNDLKLKKPNYSKLMNLLVGKHGLIKYKIKNKLERLVKCYYKNEQKKKKENKNKNIVNISI
jgi:flap endonuclease-1